MPLMVLVEPLCQPAGSPLGTTSPIGRICHRRPGERPRVLDQTRTTAAPRSPRSTAVGASSWCDAGCCGSSPPAAARVPVRPSPAARSHPRSRQPSQGHPELARYHRFTVLVQTDLPGHKTHITYQSCRVAWYREMLQRPRGRRPSASWPAPLGARCSGCQSSGQQTKAKKT
jgi:hypothetical protein